jgi:hypothetical protein
VSATFSVIFEAEELTRTVADVRDSAEAARLLDHLATNEERLLTEVRDLLRAECKRLRAQVETFVPGDFGFGPAA